MKLLLKSCLLFILFATVSAEAQNQIAGGELTYACIGNDSYKVTLVLYAKCPNPGLPASVTAQVTNNVNSNVPKATLLPSGSDEIIRACLGKPNTCEGGTGQTADALTKRVYTTTITLPSKSDSWTLVIQEGQRTIMSNVKRDDMNLTALINNKAGCNSSPTFNNNPLSFSSSNLGVIYDPGIKDPEGDKLSVKLVAPEATVQTDLQYINSSFTPTQPFSTSGPISVDANNGKLSFTPTTSGESSTVAMQITETRNGAVIGNVTREMYFQTMPQLNSPPRFTGPDTVKICQGDAGNISYEGTSPDPSAVLDILINNKQAEWSSYNATVAKSPGKAVLTLSSSQSLPVNTVKPLNISLVDDKCGIVTKTVYVKVYPKPVISTRSADTTVLCLNPFNININANGGTKPYTYSLNNTAVSSPVLNVDGAGTFLFTVKDANGCTATFQKRVISPINFANGPIACVDSLIPFYDVSAGMTFPLRANPLSKNATYLWTFTANGVTQTDTSASPKHKFPDSDVSVTYQVKMEVISGKDCKNSITKPIIIFPKPKVSFDAIDKCVLTERSDLKVEDGISSESPILPEEIQYYVDGTKRTNAVQNRHPTKLFEDESGNHEIKVIVKNVAGCVQTLSKTVEVKPKPRIIQSPVVSSYYYKCNSPGFKDTTFNYKAVVEDNALPLQVDVFRKNMSNIIVSSASNIVVPVQYSITPNDTNFIRFKTMDAFGCTNDTVTSILDPVNPRIGLKKYYCFDGDTLKLVDSTHLLNTYKWGLKSTIWDLKDGTTDPTIGFTDHRYTVKALDEARVILGVTDITGCTDSTTFQVYLSEPDTSEFQISKTLACFNEDVKIVSVKNPYINWWYFKYKETAPLLYRSFDKEVRNNTFGKSVPAGLDQTERPASNSYVASTMIFYNEANSDKNFIRNSRLPNNPLILPKQIAKPEVCHVTVTRNWRVVEQLRYSIDNTYNKCFGFDKSFKASPRDTANKEMKLVDNSWLWTLTSPQGTIIDSVRLSANTKLDYSADNSLFPQVVSPRSDPRTNPYKLTIQYKHSNGLITCPESSTLDVINEKVYFNLDIPDTLTCAFYTELFQYKDVKFLTSVDRSQTLWSYGDSSKMDTSNIAYHQFSKPGAYTVKAFVANEHGCTFEDSVKIKVKTSPKASLSVAPVCFGNQSVLNGKSVSADTNSKIVNHYWYYALNVPTDAQDPNEPDVTKSVKHTLVDGDTLIDKFPVGNNPVSLAVEDANGCFSFSPSPIFAKVTPLPESDFTALAKLTQDQDYLGFEPIEFKSVTQNTKYWKWNFGNGETKESLPTDSGDVELDFTYPYFAPPFPKEKNIYNVSLLVKTKEGCVDSVSKQIDVNAYFEMPNAFSPNEDGLHDNLLGIGKGIKEIKEFKIFNRWGEVIHSVTGTPEKDALKRGYLLWDGVYKGQVQPIGAYVYYAVVKTGYGNELIKKGNLTLLK